MSELALRAADALAAIGLWNDALTRAYYAAYHAACCVLLTEGREARSHEGTISLFGEFLARTDQLERGLGRDLRRLKEFREQADYRRGFAATEETAREEIARAHRFCDAVRRFLMAGGWIGGA